MEFVAFYLYRNLLNASFTDLRWEIPRLEANGIITGFVIQFGLSADKGQPFVPVDSREFDPTERQGTIEDLLPGQNYTFQIQAKTRVGFGQQVRWEQHMPIWAPPVPNRDVFPTELSHAASTISVRFRRNYFSDVNGQVVAYAVIVAEDYTKPTENKLTLPKWQDVQQFRTWPPYQVIPGA